MLDRQVHTIAENKLVRIDSARGGMTDVAFRTSELTATKYVDPRMLHRDATKLSGRCGHPSSSKAHEKQYPGS
jgi:hypothetical protein